MAGVDSTEERVAAAVDSTAEQVVAVGVADLAVRGLNAVPVALAEAEPANHLGHSVVAADSVVLGVRRQIAAAVDSSVVLEVLGQNVVVVD